MEDNLSNFIHLLEEREQARKEYNQYVVDFVSDTVGAAIYNLLNLPRENIEWEDIQIVGPAVLFLLTITYSPAHEPSEFLSIVDQPQEGDSPIQAQRTLTIGIPTQLLFADADVIKVFLLDIARGVDPVEAFKTALGEKQEEQKPALEQVAELTDEQIQQMLFFQQTTKGKIQ